MNTLERRSFMISILTLAMSILTLIVTPIASSLVVRYQLRESHSWWLSQQTYLQEKERIQRKFDLYERTALVLARLNGLLMDQQVFLSSRNECVYMLKDCPAKEQVNTQFVISERDRYNKQIFDQNEKIREKTAELQQAAFLGRAYFGPVFEREATVLIASLKAAKQEVVPLDEVVRICNAEISQGKTLDEARKTLGAVFDERWDKVDLKERIASFLEVIYRDITGQAS